MFDSQGTSIQSLKYCMKIWLFDSRICLKFNSKIDRQSPYKLKFQFQLKIHTERFSYGNGHNPIASMAVKFAHLFHLSLQWPDLDNRVGPKFTLWWLTVLCIVLNLAFRVINLSLYLSQFNFWSWKQKDLLIWHLSSSNIYWLWTFTLVLENL